LIYQLWLLDKLTDIALYILDTVKGGEKLPNNNVLPNEIEGQKPPQQPGFFPG